MSERLQKLNWSQLDFDGSDSTFPFGAHVSMVEVDTDTGEVKLCKIWVAHDCGKAIVPLIVRGQMEGSAYMGAAETTPCTGKASSS